MKPFFTNIIHRLLWRQHFWRKLDFPELAELYAVRMLRSVALNLIGMFVAVFMFQTGYSVLYILCFFALYYVLRAMLCLPAAYVVAFIGPKHATLLSNVLFVPSFIALFLVPSFGLPMLVIYGLTQPFANCLFNISYNVDFSKVKHVDHVGKELGFMQIMDRFGAALSPLAGGLIALAFGPRVTIVLAIVLFVVAAMPLFFTPEPVATHRHVRFRGFPWRNFRGPLLSHIGIGTDIVASTVIWPLFLVIIVFTGGTNEVYAQIGGITSVTILASLLIAKMYGVLIDKKRGRELLLYSAIGNSTLHLMRFLIATPLAAVAFNIVNEVTTTGYYMPYMKGLFDTADRDEDFRITFVAACEVMASIGGGLILSIAALAVFIAGETVGLQLQYVAAAFLALLIATHNFPIYRRR